MPAATADLLSLITADMLAGCPHTDAAEPNEGRESECVDCRDRLADDTAEYRAYAYH
ncbi:hypothetical protein [Streptomyces sp. LS1784]|uniref:hypothetical protein n=1 Tax=Streptomyces sp. LS1784 TaxID=2851533 RepID=UPI001CCCD82C|nr:hypothetical protein [Streptomyces sp. LS1784]